MSKKIQFRGATYKEVEATSGAGSGRTPSSPSVGKHKKCEKGMHWNDKKKQCMKLPPSLVKARKSAHSQSVTAYKAHPDDKRSMHQYAGSKHGLVSRQLAAKGFNQLAKKHSDRATKHSQLARG